MRRISKETSFRLLIARRLALPAALVALVAPAACGLIVGDDPTLILPAPEGGVEAAAPQDASVATDAGTGTRDGATSGGEADSGARDGATSGGEADAGASGDVDASAGASPTDASSPPACTPAAPNVTDLYVDTTFDGGTGTATCPYKTITTALDAARSIASVTTVHVAAGTYSAGETFPLEVRGISLVGAGPTLTTVVGEGIYDHSTAGGQFPEQNLNLTFLLGSNTAGTSLSGVTVKPATISTELDEQHIGILCDRGSITIPGFQSSVPAPNTFVDDAVIEVGYGYAMIVSTTSPASPASLTYQSGCNAKVTGTTFKGGLGAGVWAVGGGRNKTAGTEQYSVALAFGDDTRGQNIMTGFTYPITSMPPGNGIGVMSWDGVSSVVVANSRFEAGQNGIVVTQHAAPDNSAVFQYFEVRTSTFTNLSNLAVYVDSAARLAKLTNNTFTGNTNNAGTAVGVCLGITGNTPSSLNAPAILSARGNRFIGNDNGVVYTYMPDAFQAPALTLGGPDDWGTTAQPGGNVFRCNGVLAGGAGFDFEIAPGASRQITLAGNAWDHSPSNVIGSSAPAAAPNGTDVTYNNADTAPDVSDATLATSIPCPAGRTP